MSLRPAGTGYFVSGYFGLSFAMGRPSAIHLSRPPFKIRRSLWPNRVKTQRALRRVAAPPLDGTLHLGIAEHFVPERLPLLLSQFAKTYPRVKLEVVVDTGIPLVESLDTGQLDLAIATKTEGKGRPGQLLFQEPLVWVASNEFRLDVRDSVPLALKPHPCQFRDVALAALQRVSRPWTSSYTGNSVPSIQAAVLAGLGVSVLGAHSAQKGMRVVQDELPDLPSIDIMLFGEEKFGGAIAKALVNFVLRSVQEQENLMTKAA